MTNKTDYLKMIADRVKNSYDSINKKRSEIFSEYKNSLKNLKLDELKGFIENKLEENK